MKKVRATDLYRVVLNVINSSCELFSRIIVNNILCWTLLVLVVTLIGKKTPKDGSLATDSTIRGCNLIECLKVWVFEWA